MNTYHISQLKAGMQVVFVDTALNTHPTCYVDAPYETNIKSLAGLTALVICVEPANPGKVVGLCFRQKIAGGHSCDGRVPDGHGAYALPEQLYAPDTHVAHVQASKDAAAEQIKIDELLASFMASK